MIVQKSTLDQKSKVGPAFFDKSIMNNLLAVHARLPQATNSRVSMNPWIPGRYQTNIFLTGKIHMRASSQVRAKTRKVGEIFGARAYETQRMRVNNGLMVRNFYRGHLL